MSEIEPGEGWLEIDVSSEEAAVHAVYQLAEYDEHTGALKRAWVRVPLVPPLPTEPYTVIRTKGRKGFSDWVLTLNEHGHWAKHNAVMSAAELPRLITGFEVLSEPLTAQKREEIAFADERVKAWHKLVRHPLIQPCFDTETSLIDAILRLFDRLEARV